MRLRQATPDDDAFCFALNELTLRVYIESVYGWDPRVQREHHERWFEPERLQIIEDDAGKAAGVLDVEDREDALILARIEIVPESQGQGIGTEIVRGLLALGRPIRLEVFSENIRARSFYERLGFRLEGASRKGHVSMIHLGTESG